MISIIVAGDFCPRNRVAAFFQQRRYEDVLKEVKEVTEQADYSIVNLEAPIISDKAKPIAKCGPNISTDESVIGALQYAGFNGVTLANNHLYDYGEDGLNTTISTLEIAQIDHVGAGRNLTEASRVFYKELKGKKFAFLNCCEHEFSIADKNQGGCNPLNSVQQYYSIHEARKQADYVIVIVHGGHEYFQLPSPRMQDTYRFFIDAGADSVINHHQHCYSGYEIYREKPIVYGLGNFCFDWETEKQSVWYEGYLSRLQFEGEKVTLDIIPYVQCREVPSVSMVKDKTAFDVNIKKLNSIIADDELLNTAVDNYYASASKYSLSILQPYYGHRYLMAAYDRGLLPSLFKSIKKILCVQNHVNCESHLDKLRYALKSYHKQR